MNSSRRMLICEEALKNHSGHWFEYNKATVENNQGQGVEVELLAHQDVEPEIQSGLGAKPFFPWTSWDQIYNHPSLWRRYLGILTHNWRVYRAVALHFRKSETYDLVFVPTVVIYHLIAWWFLAKRFGGNRGKAKRIVLLIRNSSATYESAGGAPSYARSAKMMALVLRKFTKLIANGSVRIASDSHRLAKEYQQLAGIDPIVIPHPCLLFSKQQKSTERPNSKTITITLPGPARWEKGIHVLLEALENLQEFKNTPNLRIVLQWPDIVYAPDGTELTPPPEQSDRSPFEFELIRKPLSSEAYEELLARTDIIILPYLRENYFARISGVAVEAMLLGLPVIYTNDTWNSDMVERFGAGLGFENENSMSLASVLITLCDSLPHFQSQAQSASPRATAHFSSSAFLNALWEK